MNKAEQFTRRFFSVPSNWDRYDFRQPRYDHIDVEDVVEQFAEKQLTEYRDKLREVLEVTGTITKEDIEIGFLTTSRNEQ